VVGGRPPAAGGNTWTQAAIQWLTPGQAGDVWSVTLNHTTVSTTVRLHDTIGDVTTRLANAISGNDATKDFAPLVSGSQVMFKTDWPTGSEPAGGTNYVIKPLNLNFRVQEADQVDTLNVFNGNSP